jgi:hypothetical protein
MIRRVAVPALQIDPGVSLNPRSAAPSYDFADPLGHGSLDSGLLAQAMQDAQIPEPTITEFEVQKLDWVRG